MITSEDLTNVYELFVMGLPIGGLLSAIVWAVAYTVSKCISHLKE